MLDTRLFEFKSHMAENSPSDISLAQLQRQLDAARAELAQFTYIVSHDLRAPLRHINAYALIIAEDWPDMPADMAAHLDTIRQSAQLLTRQLEGLTQLSRLGTQPVNLQSVNVSAMVRELVDALGAPVPTQAQTHSPAQPPTPTPSQVLWQLAADVPPVLADAALLRQLLAQVLDNALKFSSSRAPAQISLTWQMAPAQASASTGADPGAGAPACQITLSDNGVGFAPEQAKALFQVFGRLHPAREFEGLGLGLVQCRKIAERMGCAIAIAAEVNVGCRVTITLPLT